MSRYNLDIPYILEIYFKSISRPPSVHVQTDTFKIYFWVPKVVYFKYC